MNEKSVSTYYLMGISEARAVLRKNGMEVAREELDNVNRTLRGFDASSPVGQMLRGERDFWRNQLKKEST